MAKQKLKNIKFRPSLFWDVDTKTIDPKKHARYIIERILDFGNKRELSWLVRSYPPSDFKRVLENPRVDLREKTKALWSLIYP